MNEDFRYKHIVKLPWFASAIWTAIMAIAFQIYPIESTIYEFMRLFIFGASWWFLFQSIDNWATQYRRKILFKNPELKKAYITNKLSEWEANE